MRGTPRSLLAFMLAALLAVGVVACGGDGGDEAESGSAATATQETTGSTDSAGSDAEEASAEFRTPGGDNSIQDFGEEADAGELEAATAALSGFLEARADSDWAAQCEYLAAAAVKPLEQLGAQSAQLKGKGCAGTLEALSGGLPASSRANTLTEGIASLRFEGERGFALYHGPKGVDYFIPMAKEDGEWKVGSLAPTEFP